MNEEQPNLVINVPIDYAFVDQLSAEQKLILEKQIQEQIQQQLKDYVDATNQTRPESTLKEDEKNRSDDQLASDVENRHESEEAITEVLEHFSETVEHIDEPSYFDDQYAFGVEAAILAAALAAKVAYQAVHPEPNVESPKLDESDKSIEAPIPNTEEIKTEAQNTPPDARLEEKAELLDSIQNLEQTIKINNQAAAEKAQQHKDWLHPEVTELLNATETSQQQLADQRVVFTERCITDSDVYQPLDEDMANAVFDQMEAEEAELERFTESLPQDLDAIERNNAMEHFFEVQAEERQQSLSDSMNHVNSDGFGM